MTVPVDEVQNQLDKYILNKRLFEMFSSIRLKFEIKQLLITTQLRRAPWNKAIEVT
jgi:hypothetical protein